MAASPTSSQELSIQWLTTEAASSRPLGPSQGRSPFLGARLNPKRQRWSWVVLTLIFLIGIWHDASLLTHYPVAVGRDGYYYVLQVDSLFSQGKLYYSTSAALILYLLTGLKHLIGDTVLAIKVGSVSLHAMLSLVVFWLTVLCTRSMWRGVLASALIVFPSFHCFMIAEFIKNMGAIVLLILSACLIAHGAWTKRILWTAWSVASLAAATLCHRSALPIAITMGLSTFLIRAVLRAETFKGAAIRLIAGILTIWGMVPVIVAQPVISLPEWIASEMLLIPDWPIRRVAFIERFILLLLAPPILALTIRETKRLPRIASIVYGSFALWSLSIPLNPFLNNNKGWLGITGRLSALTYILIAILVPGLFFLIHSNRRWIVRSIACAVGLLLVMTLFTPLPLGLSRDYLANRSEMIKNLPTYSHTLGDSPIVLAVHGDQFVVTSILGVPSQQKVPDGSQYRSLYWLLHHVEPSIVNGTMLVVAQDSGEFRTVLVESNDLTLLIRSLPADRLRHLIQSNPHLYDSIRPASR